MRTFAFPIAFMCFMKLSVAQVPDDMVFHLSFFGHPNDTSQSNVMCSTNNVVLTTGCDGVSNSAYLFNGINSYIACPHIPAIDFAPTDQFTLSLWVKQQPNQNYTGTDDNTVISKWRELSGNLPAIGDGGYPYTIRIFNQENPNMGGVQMIRYDGGNCDPIVPNATSTDPLNDGMWHHYVLVTDQSNNLIHSYIDGIHVASSPDNTGPVNCTTQNNAPLIIGSQDANARFFTGSIDNIRIYNRELTVNEITAISNAHVGIDDIDDRFFNISPNPIQQGAAIKLPVNYQFEKLQVLNKLGQLLSSYEIGGKDNFTLHLPVGHSGTVFLSLKLKSGKTIVKRLIVIP